MAESLISSPEAPLDRGNNDDRRQWRKQGVAVGAAASKTQVLFKHEANAGCRNPGSGIASAMTERARTLTEKHRHSDRIALTKSLPIAVWSALSCRACPLRRFAPALPKGEPLACR